MTITNSIAAKLVVAVVAVAMAFAFVAPSAKAQDASSMSLEELIALVNQLQAQLSGGASMSGDCTYVWTRSLTNGSTGVDVQNLQMFLNMSADTQVAVAGAGSPGMETTYFGPLTASAVSKFQTKYSADILVPVGLVSPTGYFGPSTMAKANSLCASMDGDGGGDDDDDDNGGALQGGAGSIEDADWISSLNNEEVGEDDEDVEVAGLEIESDGSDIELTAVRLVFDEGTGATSDFEDYADEVSVWFDGEEVARVDGDEFDDDNDWTSTLTLDGGAIIREGDTGDLVVAISAVGNIDSSDLGDEWDVEFENVRFRDAQNAVITDSSTGDIGDNAVRVFSFESFATAADTELSISKGDDEINDSRTIIIDDSNDTDNVEILSFMLEAEGDSDLEIKDFGVDIVVTGESHVDDVIVGGTNPAIRMLIDGEEVGDAEYFEDGDGVDVGTDEEVHFEDIDYTIDAGDEVEVVIVVDLLSTGDGLAEGSTIRATVGETQTDDTTLVDVEDESGEQLGDSDLTGSANGDAHSLFVNGIMVEAVSTDEDSNEGETVGTFEIVVDITAFGEDQYIHELAANAATSTDAGFYYTVYKGGVATTTNTNVSSVVTTSADDDGEYFVIDEGDTERFTITVTVDPDAGGAGLYTVELGGSTNTNGGVRFDPDNAADSASTDDTWYSIPSSEDVETGAENLVAS